MKVVAVSQFVTKAELLSSLGRLEAAEQELLRELAENPSNANVIAYLATIRAQRGDRVQAIEPAKEAIGADPTNDYGYYAMAWVYYVCDQLEDAMGAITEAIRLDPANVRNFRMRARTEARLNRHEEALQTARQSLECDPNDEGCLIVESWALLNLGRWSETEDCVQRALTNRESRLGRYQNARSLSWSRNPSRKPASPCLDSKLPRLRP